MSCLFSCLFTVVVTAAVLSDGDAAATAVVVAAAVIGREVMAVDAEDSKNRILDGRRVLQVINLNHVCLTVYTRLI